MYSFPSIKLQLRTQNVNPKSISIFWVFFCISNLSDNKLYNTHRVN